MLTRRGHLRAAALRAALLAASATALVAFAPAASGSVLGPWLPGGGPQTLSSTFDSNGYPQVAGASDGSAVAVWPDLGGTIEVARRPAGGSSFASEASLGSGSVAGPQVATGADGAVTVVWSQANRSQIMAATRTPGTSSYVTETLASGGTYTQNTPLVIVAPDGKTTVTWLDSAAQKVFVRTRPAGSSTFDAAHPVSGPTADPVDQRIADGPDGTVVTWYDNVTSGVNVTSRPPGSSASTGFGNPELIATTSGGTFALPDVAEGPDGTTTLAWVDAAAVEVATRAAGSSSSSAFTNRASFPAPSPFDASAAAGPDGAITVDWTDGTSPTTARQVSRAEGAASFGSPQDLSAAEPTWADAAQVRSAFAPDGSAVATWYQRKDPGGLNKDVVVAVSREPGQTQFDLSSVSELSAGTNHAEYPEIAVDGSGGFNVVWALFASSDEAQARWSQLATQQLVVSRTGSGSGTVASSPAGVECGSTCSARFDTGSIVTLTASPASGSKFTGWGGACSGTVATCTVTMSRLREVTAEFGPDSPSPPAPPSNSFTQGTSTVDGNRIVTPVRVPGAGRITQSATRRSHGRTVRACRAITRKTTRAGTFRLVCVLNSATRAARRHGKVRIRIRTTYTPDGGTPRTRVRVLVLRSLRPHYTG